MIDPMTIEVLSVLIYAILLFTVVLTQASYAAMTAGLAYGFSNRGEPQPGKSGFGRRIDLTLGNLKEGAIIYLPLALLSVSMDISNEWTQGAALVTILSRVIYVPVFFFGIPIVRTLVWAPSFFALPALLVGILLGYPSNAGG